MFSRACSVNCGWVLRVYDTFVPVETCHFLESDVVANANPYLAAVRLEHGQGVPGANRIALAECHFSWDVDVE